MAVVGAAVLFGSTFVPVQDAIRHAGTLPFLAVRFLFGAALLAAVAGRRARWRRWWDARTVVAGLRCGVPLLAGYVLQTAGLRFTTSSVSAFVTYLLVVMVPLLEAVTRRRLPAGSVLAGVVVATAGLFLLTGAHLSVGRGVALTLGCAAAFAVNIIEIDRAVNGNAAGAGGPVDAVALTAVQLAVVGLGSVVPGAFIGGYSMPAGSVLAALYTGLAASALAFGLQVWGQRRVGPTRTSLLLMIEPVTAAVIGWFTGARLGALAVGGAVLILGGIALSEVGQTGLHPVGESADT
ncbi:MAG TPA: DMT family transporter [Acidimicrobiales bacterium]|nr:DMT family transporter [Acidimicrobiales bacterium]